MLFYRSAEGKNADESENIHVASGIRSYAVCVRAHIAHRPHNYIGGGDVDAHVCLIIGAQMPVSLSSDTQALQLAVITAVCVCVCTHAPVCE